MPDVKFNECSNCGAKVRARRPSRSGKHFCAAPACQAAKQSFHRATRGQKAEDALDQERRAFIHALAHAERTPCVHCGLENALAGWAHRDASGTKPCYALGNRGKLIGTAWLDIVHPERVPQEAPVNHVPVTIPPVGN